MDHANASRHDLKPGTSLGDYLLGAHVASLRTADAYLAQRAGQACTVLALTPSFSNQPELRDAAVAGVRTISQRPPSPHALRAIAAGLSGPVLWVALDGSLGQLARDRLAAQGRFDQRAVYAVTCAAAAALDGCVHGTLQLESFHIASNGSPQLIDLALAEANLSALRAGLMPGFDGLAPELTQGQAPSSASDVYGMGALIYVALVGSPMRAGAPRPSSVLPGAPAALDEVLGKACHRDPNRRYATVRELANALAPLVGATPPFPIQNALPGVAPAPSRPSVSQAAALPTGGVPSAELNIPASGPTVAARLQAALADPSERWLVNKGGLDYGPYTLRDVTSQIERGEVLETHTLMDKDTGARVVFSDHPLLGAMVHDAQARLAEARRAHAEVQAHRAAKRRSLGLYASLAGVVSILGVGGYFASKALRNDKGPDVAGVATLGAGHIDVTLAVPKPPAKRAHNRKPGGGPSEHGGDVAQGSEDLSLDLGDDDDASATLEMGTVYKVYAKSANQLGACMRQAGTQQANVGIIIDGPSGKITFVRVNGQTSGALVTCMGKVLRALQFPTTSGRRTRAEFPISI